jgi:hypothetical protein
MYYFLLNGDLLRLAFRGLTHEKGIEQAELARNLSEGHGYKTKIIRPRLMADWKATKGTDYPGGQIYTDEVIHSPLNPWVNSIALTVARNVLAKVDAKASLWTVTPITYHVPADRVIAAVSALFFLTSLFAWYFVGKQLFDSRMGYIGVGLLLVCDRFWAFAFTGLPQNLMLFLFGIASLIAIKLTRNLEAADRSRWTLAWAAGLGLVFGILMLAHGIMFWVLLGAVLFFAISARPWGLHAGIILVAAALVYSPWMLRNYKVCGNPLGQGIRSTYHQIRGNENQIFRTLDETKDQVQPTDYRTKLHHNTIGQMAGLSGLLGTLLVAPAFIFALLHTFKQSLTSRFRWAVLCMWLGAIFGMSFCGFPEFTNDLKANDIHLLFIPLLVFYGTAFVLTLWSRLEIRIPVINAAFVGLIFMLSCPTLLLRFLDRPEPYVLRFFQPNFLDLGEWTSETEIICTDSPGAVAWYSNRRALLLPMTPSDFIQLNDFTFNNRIAMLYFTPITLSSPLIDAVILGEYRHWARFLTFDQVKIPHFPLQVGRLMDPNRTYILYADRARWTGLKD